MDDATGTVPAAMFCREEDTPSYFLLMGKLIQHRGIPLSIYNNRHPVLKFTSDIDRYPAGPTQFGRAMEELGIRQIFARSPQAKGRVERAAGTFQDRLVTELRLAGAATITEANEVLNSFLPRFNEKFGVQAEQDCPAYRFLDQSVSLDRTPCFKHRRKVSRDNTVKYNRRTLQLLPDGTRPTYAGVQVLRSRRTWMAGPGAIPRADYPYTGGSATSGPAERNCRRSSGKLRVGPRRQRRWRPVRLPPGDVGNR